MIKPDYQSGSIVNLMASISRGLGSISNSYSPCLDLLPKQVAAHKNVILLVLDGLGFHYLKNKVPNSFLAQNIRGTLTSVFPSTTAAAITTFATGLAPQQHAVTGWYMYFNELQQVLAVLPFKARNPQVNIEYEFDILKNIIAPVPLVDNLSCEKIVISPRYIVDSFYNCAISGSAKRIGYKGLSEFSLQIIDAVRANNNRKYIYAYCPDFDSSCHYYGTNSVESRTLFGEIDETLHSLVNQLIGQDTLLIVTADHGLIDTAIDKTIVLNDYPEILNCLSQPLCGEPRVAYCYVNPGMEEKFELLVNSSFGSCCEIYQSRELLSQGFFGLQKPSSHFTDRIGNYVLVMKENYIIKDYMPEEKPFQLIGVHGGLSADEMQVPLIVFSSK